MQATAPRPGERTAVREPGPLLCVNDLCFAFPQRSLFDRWHASIGAGVTLVCGDESSGKTSLLRLLAGDLDARAGQLQIGDIRLDVDPLAYRAQVFRTDPSSPQPDQVTLLAWFDALRGRYPHFDGKMADDLLHRLSLVPHQHKPMFMLSTGSRRKAWLAAAFASGATVALLDQPFAALDKASIGVVLELLAEFGRLPDRALVVADYGAPHGIDLTQTIELG